MVMQYFVDKPNEEPFYYWNCQTDEQGRLVNLFFHDMRSAEDYRAFGDVLLLDTTYRTNMYNLICCPFVGIDHHTFTIMFGMGFLSDETTSSFEWLFREFLKSMDGAEPKVIFTDQCMSMMMAIETTFPNSKHRLCQWHINRNAAKKFGSLNGKPTFKKLWHRCMNEVETEGEFDDVWKEIMTYTNSKTNGWFTNMYNLRRRWASVFTKEIFTGGLLATSRSKGTNRVVKSVQKCSATLYEFVTNYEEMKISWRRKEIEEDTLGIWVPGQLLDDNALFSQAASRYTRNVYKKFEYEARKTFSLVLPHNVQELSDDNLEFTCTTGSKGRQRKIIFNKTSYISSCTCRMWESEGLLCRHILKVYYFMNHFTIPEAQILKRWTKTAKEISLVEKVGTEVRSTLPYMLFVNTVMRYLYEMACSCVDNKAGRSMIIGGLESLRRQFFSKIGLPPIKKRRNVVTDMNRTDLNGCYFTNPKIVKEKGFVAARESRALQAKKKLHTDNGDTSTSQHPKSSSLPPRFSCDMSEQLRSGPSLHPKNTVPHKDDVGSVRPSSQS